MMPEFQSVEIQDCFFLEAPKVIPKWDNFSKFGKIRDLFPFRKVIFEKKFVGRKKKFVVYENVLISDIGSEGKSIARVNDMVVFTSNVIPGDMVDLQVTRSKKRYQEARVIRIRKESADRIKPFCHHFGTCGGCKWQFLPYEKQLYYKGKQVTDQLTRIGGLVLPPINPVIGSGNDRYYRNKLEYTFSDKGWLTENEIRSGGEFTNRKALGFHIPGLFDKVVHIRKCWLQGEISDSIRNYLYQYALDNNLDFFDLRNGTGFLRNLIIRTTLTGEVMVIIALFRDDSEAIVQLLESLKCRFPEITSLNYVINNKRNDTLYDQKIICYSGRDFIIEEIENLKFKISPKSFFQTNSEQVFYLYRVVREYAGLTGKEVVYDLYTGTGTIANFLALHAEKVIGIDNVADAISDARENARFNNILNTRFFDGDIKEVLTTRFLKENGQPDVVVTDPPRAGMHGDVVKTILEASPQKIVYVSCNPGTQARDLSMFSSDYQVEKVQPVDMFPHTQHVENVVFMRRK